MEMIKNFAKYFFIVITILLCNCKGKNDTEINLNGYYGMSQYFQSKNTNTNYVETFLLKIDKNKIKMFGTVQTWGNSYSYKLNRTKDTILLGQNTKIYGKIDNHNILYFETNLDNKIKKIEYKKIPNIEKIVEKEGINSVKLGNLLSNLLIVGKYKYKNKIITFNKEGTVENLDEFRNYRIRPRLGTCSYYDDRIIETENGTWKYQKKNENLILNKYSTKRDEFEMYILGNEKIELEKITSH